VVEHASHIDTAKGNLVVNDLTIWFNEPLFNERSHIKIHSGLGILNWLAIVPDEPTGRKVSTLDSPMSQGPCAFIINPPACLLACVGRHSPLLTCLPHSHLVPWCRLQRLPLVLLSLIIQWTFTQQDTPRPSAGLADLKSGQPKVPDEPLG